MRILLIPFVVLVILGVLSIFVPVAFGSPSGSHTSSDLHHDSDIPPSDLPLPLTSKHDTAVVAAPDGTIYLVEINSGKILWSFASGSSIYSSYQAVHDHEGEWNNATTWPDDFFIDIGEDWQLYINGNGLKNVKLPVSMEEFLKSTPFVSPSGGIMLGSKKSTVFIVDAKTGKVIHTLCSDTVKPVEHERNDENPIVARTDFGKWIPHGPMNLDGIEVPLYVTRKDYSLKFTNINTGKILWYLMFAEIEASYQCNAIMGRVLHTEDQVGLGKNVDTQIRHQCPTKPVIYRMRDHSSFESLFESNSLPNAFPGDKVLSLPPPDLDPMFEPVEKLVGFHQSNGGDIGLALPTPEREDSGIVALSDGDIGQVHNTDGFGNLIGSRFWFVSLFGGLMLVIVIVTFFVSRLGLEEHRKLNKQVQKPDVKALATKKKKPRKSGTNSKTAEKKKNKNVSHDQMVKGINLLSDRERAERFLQNGFPNNSDGIMDGRNIGRLFVSKTEIAKGSNGTVVLEGIYNGRPVAVKRLVQTHHDVASKESQNLIASDHHPNIVRWYGVEYDQDFVYLALERCTCSLYDLILSYASSQNQETHQNGDSKCVRLGLPGDNHEFQLSTSNGCPSHHLLKLMRDVVRGLAHLHELGIIHRDLKPQNVLVTKERVLCAKVSDMGISKRLSGDMSSITKHATGYGSSGWQAPEQLLHERETRAVDLFSLGCLLFFCITGGKHPFGEILERDMNIVNNQKDLFLIESLPEATDLISSLLHRNPELRPNAVQVMSHPLFWGAMTRLSFLRDASDRVELEDREKVSELLQALESVGNVALGGKWDEKMDTAFINDIGRYRRYKFDSVRDLLRVIRNKLNHYRELPKDIRGILGQVPEGFDNYFSTRFPNLLIEVYKVFHLYCADDETFSNYFKMR